MKLCKKLLSIPMILCIIFSLTGCIIIPRYKRYDDIDVEKVSTIEIYGIHKSERITGSDVNADTLAYSLDENEFSDFLNKLSKIQFKDYILIVPGAVDPSFSYGNYVVKIKYNNGNYILISDGSFGESFDADGNRIDKNHFGCDDDEWENLIFDYLPDEIINYSDETSNDETSIVDNSNTESEITDSSDNDNSNYRFHPAKDATFLSAVSIPMRSSTISWNRPPEKRKPTANHTGYCSPVSKQDRRSSI